MRLRSGAPLADNRQIVSNVVGFAIKPGYSASATLAGQDIATRYTKLGAAEQDGDDKRRKGPSTVGWIAIGVGAVVVVTVAAAAIAFANICDPTCD